MRKNVRQNQYYNDNVMFAQLSQFYCNHELEVLEIKHVGKNFFRRPCQMSSPISVYPAALLFSTMRRITLWHSDFVSIFYNSYYITWINGKSCAFDMVRSFTV